MEPARDNKRGEDGQRNRTVKYHRLPLGEKGVGRFSADKLGLHLEIISRFCRFDPKTQEVVFLSPLEVIVKIEGNKFLESAYLDEIECTWETRIPEEFKEGDHGTLLRISQLRSDWDKKLVKKVHLGLARLSSPISKAEDFEIWFKCGNFKEFNGLIQNPLLKNAPYLLDADINSSGIMTYTIRTPDGTGKPDSVDLRKGQERFEIKRGKDIDLRMPTCGPFRFKLYAFERDRRFWKKYEMDKEKLELLNALCGVSIYRDNFRVLPYGEQGNDWLNFDRRRVLNPGKVLGNDRVVGYVEISQSLNPQLKDKTNREGLIEVGDAFNDLRDLAIEAADLLGLQRYMGSPHTKRSKEKVEEAIVEIDTGRDIVSNSSEATFAALERANENISSGRMDEARNEILSATITVDKNKDATKKIDSGKRKLLEELAVSEEAINNLIALSGIGMTAERMTHEFSRSVRLAEQQLQKSLGVLSRFKEHPEVTENIRLAISQMEIVRTGLQQLEPLYYSKRRYTECLDVSEIARSMKAFFSSSINDLGVKVNVVENGKLSINMGKGHLMQIFSNLFDNSLYWLKFKPIREGREIKVVVTAKERSIIFADDGPGIDPKIETHLFEPFISLKPDGRGLGLYIINDILQNYKSEIEVMADSKTLTGANFKITFPEELV